MRMRVHMCACICGKRQCLMYSSRKSASIVYDALYMTGFLPILTPMSAQYISDFISERLFFQFRGHGPASHRFSNDYHVGFALFVLPE